MNKKNIFIIIFILLIIAVIGYIIFIKNLIVSTNNPTPLSNGPTISPSATSENFCTIQDLQSEVSFDGAAGNIYGTFTIKNITNKPCTIIGNNKMEVTTFSRNIAISYQDTGKNTLKINASQTIYGQVHYPNGPQCSGDIITSPISFMYAISPTAKVNFATMGHISSTITTCTAVDEPTEIDLWNFSTTPFH